VISDKSYRITGETITDLLGGSITDLSGMPISDLSQVELPKLLLSIIANLISTSALHTITDDEVSIEYRLMVANALCEILSETPPLVPIASLVVTNVIQSIITTNITTMTFTKSLNMRNSLSELIDQIHTQIVYNLQLANTSHLLTSDEVNAIVAALLLPITTVHTLSGDSPLLSGIRNLIANTSVNPQTSDSVNLAALFAMGLVDALQILPDVPPALAFAYRLPINSALQEQLTSLFALITEGYLFISDALSEVPTSSPALTRITNLLANLATQEILSSTAYIAAVSNLILSDSLDTQTAENIVFSLAQMLGMYDATHTQTADKLLVSMLAALGADNVLHTMTSDQLIATFTQAIIIISGALNQQIAGNIDLISPWVIWPDSGISQQVVDQISFAVSQLLAMNNATNLVTAKNISLLLDIWLNVLYSALAKEKEYSFHASADLETQMIKPDAQEFIAHDGLK